MNIMRLRMSDKEYNQLKKKINLILSKWVRPMGIGWYSVSYIWARDKDGDTAARVDYSLWMYKKFSITFFMHTLNDLDDKTLEDSIVHELCHILLAPLANNMSLVDTGDEKYRTDLIEQTTEIVKDSMFWVRAAGKRDKNAN